MNIVEQVWARVNSL